MAQREQTQLAKQVFESFCRSFDSLGWRYQKSARKRQMQFPVEISGSLTDFTVTVHADGQLVRLVATLPEKLSQEQYPQLLAHLCQANCNLNDGCFYLDPMSNALTFRIAAFFHESSLGADFLPALLRFAIACIKRYGQAGLKADVPSAPDQS